MNQVKRRMTKGMRQVQRTEYASIERNPLIVVTWATDPANIGGMVRSCEAHLAAGLHGLKTPSRATSVGTSNWQPWTASWELAERVEEARRDGYTIVALEVTDESTLLPLTVLPERMCLLTGNEGSGLPKSALALADLAVEIPQFGFVGSLNVVSATSIALYEWARQHRTPLA